MLYKLANVIIMLSNERIHGEYIHTDERFLLKLPSLILSGATFFALDFLSWGFGVDLVFLRAFGPGADI